VLQREGHQSVSFDLPGHGQDRTPRDRVTLKAYAEAIRDQLKQCSREPLVLVGHSLAGIGIAEAMAKEPIAIDQLVMVAALVLKPGERAIDRIPESRRPTYFELAAASSDQSFALSTEVTRSVFFNDVDDSQAASYHAQLTPQPLSVTWKKSNSICQHFPARSTISPANAIRLSGWRTTWCMRSGWEAPQASWMQGMK
jgi:pimeloyl-ACP methyl ester carboxylesterase